MRIWKRIVAKLMIIVMCFTSIGFAPAGFSWASETAGNDDTDKSSVTVYLSISEDGTFVTGKDTNQTVVSHVPITVEYFDLAEYGLEEFYRYESEAPEDGGAYVGDTVLKQPTVLHLFIRAIEEFYLGGEKLEVGGDALTLQGSATSMFMKRFWGHDENLMYFVDHAYPLMRAGWGATADYILLEEGMEIDVAMFSDWNFYTYGAFAYFTPTKVTAEVGEKISLQMMGVSTMSDVNGQSREEMPMIDENLVYAKVEDAVAGYSNDSWEMFDVMTDEEGQATISFGEPGTYLVSSTPLYETFRGDNDTACVAPPVATITVTGEKEEEDATGTENLTVLSDLYFTTQAAASSARYAMTPVFDAANGEYTVYVPDCADSIAVWGKTTDETADVSASANLTAEYTDIDGNPQAVTKTAGSNSGLNLAGLLAKGEAEATVNLTASCGLSAQKYVINIKRTPTLENLSIEDGEGNGLYLDKIFSAETTDYAVSVPAGVDALYLSIEPTDTVYKTKVDGSNIDVSAKTKVELSADNPQLVQIDVTGSNGETTVYNLTLNKKQAVKCSFVNLIPGTAVQLTDSNGNDLFKDVVNETALNINIQEDETYTYKLSLKGYENKMGTFTAGTADQTIDCCLTQLAVNPEIDQTMTSMWPNFRGNIHNNAVTASKTPTTADTAQLLWAVKNGGGWSGAPSSPIFVEDDLVFTTNTEIVKIDRVSGEVIQRGTMISKSAFSLTPPTYADGMIFVALAGGRIQAFNAKTLESLWVYQDSLGGQPNSPLLYHDGYIYTGFWNSELKNANYVAILAADENFTEPTETKTASWTHTHKGGFYWSGAIAAGGAIVVGGENGAEDEKVSTGVLYAFHPESGKIIDQITDIDGDIRSSIVYDEVSGRYCFVSRGGSFYSLQINNDGTFDRESMKKVALGGYATSVPVVYNGRAYVGVSGTSVLGAYSGHKISVVDLGSNSIAYNVPTRGYPQASGLLTTGYEAEDGYVYVYFIENYTPGIMRVIKDKAGQTAPILDKANCGILSEREADDYKDYADTLFTPRAEQAEFAIGSPIVDEYGTMYFKNDSSYMMALGSKVESIEITKLPNKTEYEAGEYFDPTGMKVVAHLANGLTRDVTDYVTYPTEVLTEYDLEVEIAYPYVKYNDKEKKSDYPSTYIPVASINAAEIDKVQAVMALIDQIASAEDPEAAAITARSAFDDLGTKLQKYVANEDLLIDYELRFAEANIEKGSPKGVTLKVTASDYNALKLSWSKNSYADGYEVYRSTTEGSRGSLIKTINDNDTTTLTNSGLTVGKTYYYTVRPFILVDGDPVGEVYSPQVAGSTSVTVPVLKAERNGYDSIKLTWTQVTGATGYNLYRYDAKAKKYTLLKTFMRGTDVSYIDTSLTCGTTYQYKLTTLRNSAESDFSVAVSATPTLEKPSNVKAARSGYASVKLTWGQVDGADGYKIYRYSSSKKTYTLIKTIESGSTLSYKNTGLTTGTTYQYKVKAYRGAADSEYSAVVSAKPTLSKPTGLKAARSGYSSIKLTWNKVSGAKGYKIYRYHASKEKYVLIKTIESGSTLSYKNTGLATGTTYKYKIKAYRGSSDSEYSAVVSAKPTLSKVTNFKVKAGTKKATLSWTKVSGANGYVIYRATSKNGTYKAIKTIKSGSTVSYVNKSLTKGKTYYYKIRAYRTVNGKKVYSSYTGPVYAKVR